MGAASKLAATKSLPILKLLQPQQRGGDHQRGSVDSPKQRRQLWLSQRFPPCRTKRQAQAEACHSVDRVLEREHRGQLTSTSAASLDNLVGASDEVPSSTSSTSRPRSTAPSPIAMPTPSPSVKADLGTIIAAAARGHHTLIKSTRSLNGASARG
jgi:hypothetical protein